MSLKGNNSWEGDCVRLRAPRIDDWEIYDRDDVDSDSARRNWEIPFPRSPEGTRKWLARTLPPDFTIWSSPPPRRVRVARAEGDAENDLIVNSISGSSSGRTFLLLSQKTGPAPMWKKIVDLSMTVPASRNANRKLSATPATEPGAGIRLATSGLDTTDPYW